MNAMAKRRVNLRLRKRVRAALREVSARDGRVLVDREAADLEDDLVEAVLRARLPGESVQSTIVRLAGVYVAKRHRYVVSEKCRTRACNEGLACLCERLDGCTIGPLAQRLAPAPPLHEGCECTQEEISCS